MESKLHQLNNIAQLQDFDWRVGFSQDVMYMHVHTQLREFFAWIFA